MNKIQNKCKFRIGQEFASIREKHGYSQAKLAELMDISVNYISDIELGELNEREFFSELHKILGALRTEFDIVNPYVDIKLAKGLKELGFDEEVDFSSSDSEIVFQSCTYSWTPIINKNEMFKIPTKKQAFAWIRRNFKNQVLEFYKENNLSLLNEEEILSLCIDYIISKK